MAWSMGSKWVAGYLKFFAKGTGNTVGGFNQAGPVRKVANVDVDAQNATLLAATMASGLLTHTSTTGAGTLTMDTGTNIDAQFPEWQVGECFDVYYLNDGNQTVTLTSASGATVLSAQTVATLQGRTIHFLKTATATYSVWA